MILFKKLHDEAIVPHRGSDLAAGFDLYADQSLTIWPTEQRLVGTGIACALAYDKAGLIWPRSGLAVKHEIDTRAGVIDADYRGEIKVLLRNESTKPFDIQAGMRIAQLVVTPYYFEHDVVDQLPESKRGLDGFGSTGK